ncbi:hypothetical protein [Parasediminibacterium sp. JCM 36343]|uniref:hypothetical protein n=1 Tax=Parasediminibacterium sp. JCM 36343 TaxID=3374279 RepID=UPI00397DCE44
MLQKRIITAAFFIEILSATYLLVDEDLAATASILYFISGLAIAIALLFLPQAHLKLPTKAAFTNTFNGYKLSAIAIMGIMMGHFGQRFMEDTPLNYKESDMLPIIKVMSQRFVSGHWTKVYDTIPDIWQGIKPIYLPAMWLPFSVAEWLHIDIRWMTIAALFLAFSAAILLWDPFASKRLSLTYKLSVFMLFWWLFTNDSAGLIPYTEEGVVIINYVLLTLALLTENYLLIGAAATFCLLSRYAFVGWLPAMLVLLYVQGKRKQWLHLKISGIVCFSLLVLLPFGWSVLKNFISLPGAYINFAERVWKDAPHVFEISLGFARFFGPQHIALQHYSLICLSFAAPMVFVLACAWVNYKKGIVLYNIPLAALKLTLVIFYTFIDVPYLYLFYTSPFISCIIVAYWVSYRKKEQEQLSNTMVVE